MKESLYDAVIAELEKMGMEPRAVEISKLNDELLHGISINSKSKSMEEDGVKQAFAPTVYLESFIDDHIVDKLLKEDQLPAVANNIARKMVEFVVDGNGHEGPAVPFLNDLKSNQFVLRLCDKELNKKFLSDKPYLDAGNGFALFIRVRVCENIGGWYSATLTNALLKELDLSKEEAFKKAFAEAEKSDTTELCMLPELLTEDLTGEKPRNLLNERGHHNLHESSVEAHHGLPETSMYVLRDDYYGAAALYRPGLKEKVAEILNDDFYVLPSSVHEFILMPAGNSPCSESELAAMVATANKDVVERNEVLSYKVQKFVRRRGKLISCMAPSYS